MYDVDSNSAGVGMTLAPLQYTRSPSGASLMKGILASIGLSVLGAALLAGLGVLLSYSIVPRPPKETADSPPVPFRDLEAVIARTGISSNWTIHRQPDFPGPY